MEARDTQEQGTLVHVTPAGVMKNVPVAERCRQRSACMVHEELFMPTLNVWGAEISRLFSLQSS